MERILIIKLGALGDIILAMDAFYAIREHHKNAHISLLTRPSFAQLTRKMPWFDDVLEDPRPRWYQIKKCLAVRRLIHSGQYDRIYDLQGNDRSGFYFRLIGKNHCEWCGPVKGCSHRRVGFNTAPLPSAERLLRFLESLDISRQGHADTSWLTGDVAAFGLPKQFVLLVPGCSPQHPHKRWPPGQYADLAKKLYQQSIGVVAIGTEVDRAAIEQIKSAAPFIVDLTAKTDIGQIAELARLAESVVGNDTGPMHIAAVTGAPSLVLMSGKSDPVRMRPNGSCVNILQKESLNDLSVENVFSAIQFRQP